MQGDAGDLTNWQLRLKGMAPITDELEIYGLATPGFSLFSPPANGKKQKGFALGLAAGANYKFNPRWGVFMEAGYHFGFQTASETVGNDTKEYNGIKAMMFNLGLQAYSF
jgi:hypothetical protein